MVIALKRVASTMNTEDHTPPPDGDRKRSHKQRYSLADLPFPGGSSIHIVIWRKTFVPKLICWAGTQGDPFGTNCQMEGHVVILWKRTYPSIMIEKASRNHEIVMTLVSPPTFFKYQINVSSAKMCSTTGAAILARPAIVWLPNSCGATPTHLPQQKTVRNMYPISWWACVLCTSLPIKR